MVAEARLAERLGIASPGLSARIAAALIGLGLPVAIPPEFPPRLLSDALRVDKKKAAGVVRFSLPVDIGKVELGVPVEDLGSIFDNAQL
jgi:3-dehydroquinate synthetase